MKKIITVKLNNKNEISIDPLSCDVEFGSHQIEWKMKDDSEEFDFADPPVTFDNTLAPMRNISPNGRTATCTDNNQNGGKQAISYSYNLHRIGPEGPGAPPAKKDPALDGTPAIRNKPK